LGLYIADLTSKQALMLGLDTFCPAWTGQLFILLTIKEFGALLFAAVMTTRQFLSILVSSMLFANPLSRGQWYVRTIMMKGDILGGVVRSMQYSSMSIAGWQPSLFQGLNIP
jgi:hypothetical protein